MKYLQVKLPDDMHKSFKRKCFNNEIDMSEKVREWIIKNGWETCD